MLRFAKVFETAGLQLVVRANAEFIECDCGRPTCKGGEAQYSILLEVQHELRGKGFPGLLQAGIPTTDYQQALDAVARFEQPAARLAVQVLQESHAAARKQGVSADTPIYYGASQAAPDIKEAMKEMMALIFGKAPEQA